MIVAFFLLKAFRVPVAFALGLSAMYAMWEIGYGFNIAVDLIATGIQNTPSLPSRFSSLGRL